MNTLVRLLLILLVTTISQVHLLGQPKPARSTQATTGKQPPGAKSATNKPLRKTPFVSTEGRFSIVLPPDFATFEVTSESHRTPLGETLTVVSYKAHDVSAIDLIDGLVMYIDYPKRIFDEQGVGQILETAQRGTLSSLGKTTILHEERFLWSPESGLRMPLRKATAEDQAFTPIQNFKIPGCSVLVSVPDTFGRSYGRFDFFVIKPRTYAVSLVYSNRAAFKRSAVKTYFDSFRLIDAVGKKPQ